MVVGQPGSSMHDPTLWQPLAFAQTAVQGLAPVPAEVQPFVGAQWGSVKPFAPQRLHVGAPPTDSASSRSYREQAVAVIRAAASLPSTPIVASSPVSWNALANGAVRSSLQRDVKLYLALNGALHDAAIAAWGAKREYQAPRPISMIRYMAFQGQSSDPKGPSYNAEGLPLVPGLVELVTSKTRGSLAGDVGQVAVLTRNGWVLGTRWTPNRPTPPSPGWVSGDSAFAYAAAALLDRATGASFDTAAANASDSGLDAGIDIPADDAAGARLGTVAGTRAWTLAQRYFSGAAGR